MTESFRLEPQKIETVDGQEVTQLRGIVLPLLRLKNAFGLGKYNGTNALRENEHKERTRKPGFVVVIGLIFIGWRAIPRDPYKKARKAIQNAKANGYTDEQVVKEFSKVGWDPNLVKKLLK